MSDTYTCESTIALNGNQATLLSELRNDSTGEVLKRKASDISEQLIAKGWTPPAQDTSGDRYVVGFREGRESLHGLLQELVPALPSALREKIERVLR